MNKPRWLYLWIVLLFFSSCRVIYSYNPYYKKNNLWHSTKYLELEEKDFHASVKQVENYIQIRMYSKYNMPNVIFEELTIDPDATKVIINSDTLTCQSRDENAFYYKIPNGIKKNPKIFVIIYKINHNYSKTYELKLNKIHVWSIH